MPLSVVLHPDVVDFLRTHPESSLKRSVWQCLEKLKKRQFDGGLRVKKLKGIAKGVWEARINQANRLTYTYEKSRQPATGEKQVYLAVQDICLDHDDVSRSAKRVRNRTHDAQWLDADEVEVIGNLEVNRQSLTLTEQEALKKAEAEDLQISDDVIDELLGNIQWQIVESEEEWEQAIIKNNADLSLKLTPEEYNLVSCYGDLLLSGNAGTGKTTVGLYRLLKSLEIFPAGKRLYVAYNPILVEKVQKQFQQLVGNRVAEFESVFQFKTIRELCLEILLKAGQSYQAYDEVDYQVFSQLYLAPERKQYPAALVWDEIRSLIKGSQLNVAQKLLLEKDYKQLGKKKASVIPYNKREVVYKLAAWYQRRLEEEKRFDEIDLARETLQLIQQGQGERYQLIVCDEVQDFTELQLELLMQLVTPEGSLFFAGDLNQMISPSGFRWKDLKTRFFKKQRQPLLKSLDYNFRSVRALVNLANQVLSLRTRLLNESMTQTEQPASSYGESARLIAAPSLTLQPTLKVLNPEDAILVRTEAEKEQFSGDFQSSFVFTIEEAKGLEFDTVFLVEFFQPSQSLWDKVLSGQQALKDTEIPELRLELNLLYVAVTRARRILNIWETQRSKIWNQPELIGLVPNLEPQLVTEARIEPTSQMWRERGLYYLEVGFYRQSAECFEKAGDLKLSLETKAKLLLRERKHSEAAEVFVRLEFWEQAAQQFELAKQWQKAAECWQKIENIEQQQVCDIYALEDAKQWEDAALRWERLEKFEEAKRCWLKSNNQPKKHEIEAVEFEQNNQDLKKLKEDELLRIEEKNNAHSLETKSLNQFKENNSKQEDIIFIQKAMIYFNRNNFYKAIQNYTKAIQINPNSDIAYGNRANCYLIRSDYQKAVEDFNRAIQLNPNNETFFSNRANCYLVRRDYQKAVEDFNRAIQLNPNHEMIYFNRAITYSEKGNYQKALEDFNRAIQLNPNVDKIYSRRGLIYFKLEKYQEALEDFNRAIQHDPNNASAYSHRGIIYSNTKNYQKALEDFNRVIQLKPKSFEAYHDRGTAYSTLEKYQEAIKDFNRAIQLNPKCFEIYSKRGTAYSNLGKYQEAIKDFNQAILLNSKSDIAYSNRAITYSKSGNYQKAIEDFNRAIQLNPDHEMIYFNRAITYSKSGNYQKSFEDYTRAIQLNSNVEIMYCGRGLVCFKLEKYQEAIEDFNRAIQLDPENSYFYIHRSLTFYKLKDYQNFFNCFQKAFELSQKPYNSEVRQTIQDNYQTVQSFRNDLESLQHFMNSFCVDWLEQCV